VCAGSLLAGKFVPIEVFHHNGVVIPLDYCCSLHHSSGSKDKAFRVNVMDDMEVDNLGGEKRKRDNGMLHPCMIGWLE
jgi:hypothetical protein